MNEILLSYNEVQSLARKAASGAGLPYGIAEDIGNAALWLSARGVDALEIVVAALGGDPKGAQAVLRGQAAIDALCCGEIRQVCLADLPEGGLLIGLAGAAAMETGVNIALERQNGDVVPLAATRNADGLMTGMKALRCLPGVDVATVSGATRPAPALAEAYAAALALAARTYVPASELSRARGAGAGTTDND